MFFMYKTKIITKLLNWPVQMKNNFLENFKKEFNVLKCKGDNHEIFYEGGKSIVNDISKQLHILVGAMILDGYDENDSCIKYVNDFIKELEKGIKIENIKD